MSQGEDDHFDASRAEFHVRSIRLMTSDPVVLADATELADEIETIQQYLAVKGEQLSEGRRSYVLATQRELVAQLEHLDEHLFRNLPYLPHTRSKWTFAFIYKLIKFAEGRRANTGPEIDLTGGLVEFSLRKVLNHDELEARLLCLEETYMIDVKRFGERHHLWGVFAARYHLYWWTLLTFIKEGSANSPAGKLFRSLAKKWGF